MDSPIESLVIDITDVYGFRSINAGGVSYNVTEKQVDLGVTNATTEFNVRMDLYTDKTYGSVMTNQVVSSFDPLYDPLSSSTKPTTTHSPGSLHTNAMQISRSERSTEVHLFR